MDDQLGPIFHLAERQRGVAARWQMTNLGFGKADLECVRRRFPRVTRGVYALAALDELSWFMAAALAYGPMAVVSHRSALMVLGLRPIEAGDIHVSVPHTGVRRRREGVEIHRRRALTWGDSNGIPVTSPTRSMLDACLEPYELYRALEEAEHRGYRIELPRNDVVRLKERVRGRTRSDAEARFLLLCHDQGFALPLVNHELNGIETDFHWPRARLVVEVDGWAFHKERAQFEEDRRRGLVHSGAGWDVVRVSARQVERSPALVAEALRGRLT